MLSKQELALNIFKGIKNIKMTPLSSSAWFNITADYKYELLNRMDLLKDESLYSYIIEYEQVIFSALLKIADNLVANYLLQFKYTKQR